MPLGRHYSKKFQRHLATTLDFDLAEEFVQYCKGIDKSVAFVIRELIQIYMEQVKKKLSDEED